MIFQTTVDTFICKQYNSIITITIFRGVKYVSLRRQAEFLSDDG